MKEIGRNCHVKVIEKEAILASSKVISLNSPEGIEEDHKK
jgi:hypothetical protein